METETSDRTPTRWRKERGKVVTVAREGRPPSATSKKNKSGSSYIRRKLSCFNPTATDDDQPSARDVDESPTPGEKDSLRRVPVHLVIMVNGIIGSAANWSYAAKQFVKKLPEDVIVHCSECNSNTLTFDGVDIMGQRLAKEVSCITESRPKLQKISFVAHSLGGLVARYAIALLYRQNLQREPSEENGDSDNHGSGTLCLEENSKGRIAGLEPMNFITFATPHLGSRWHKQVPILCGFQVLEKMATRTSWIFGRTGKHLVLRDHDDEKPPLLVQMVNDCENLQFMSALQSFRRRVVYSNVCFDHIVGWKTSSIRHQHELPKPHTFVKNTKYPHIVHVETPKTTSVQQEFLTEAKVKTVDIEVLLDIMLRGLNKVTWERVDVSFHKSKQRYFAHSTIQVKTYCINSDGADVILHLIDNFLV